ncbi:hypothetical protein [Mariniblastus fucicola]|uniref:Uncharacterized protein n=1 Tax=Mariniblastus fucicola TaxID=980251 RepID=A0A5B9PI38_9BACT|nr:hypothetical protein [Mariniblastus fucicola]QEG24342.1 hypothetical protein MFFC18_42610 [Mariniblastus fucicola]
MGTSSSENAISKPLKRVLSCTLGFYLFVLILGPLSNPVGSESLTRPLAKTVGPIHRALFLGHGYRFFAPNPGPSHLVEFQITMADGSVTKGRIPDRDDATTGFPRLEYHRWFMLSETIWTEHLMTPPEADFQDRIRQLERLATEKQIAGHHEIASQIRADIEVQKKSYKNVRQRIDDLVQSVARKLLQVHGGTKIELYVREREIPHPVEVQEGAKLGDARFLKPDQPPMIGSFTAKELGLASSNEQLPDAEQVVTEPLPARGERGSP